MSNNTCNESCNDANQDDENEQWTDALDTIETDPNEQSSQFNQLSRTQLLSRLNQEYPLHKAIYENDIETIVEFLKLKSSIKDHINKKDVHGNTPLHLACMLGSPVKIVYDLLNKGAAIDIKNLQRWSPFAEACSYGDRDVITLLTIRANADVQKAINHINQDDFSFNLQKIKNYRLILKWEFQSWIPFLTKVLPSDICVINKQGGNIRIDTKLLDFEMFSWRHGDSYLVYSPKYDKKWMVVDNKTKKYQHFSKMHLEKNIIDKVDDLMSNDIIEIELKSKDIQLTRSSNGWIWKSDKSEKIGNYNAALYNFNNIFLVTKKRREHLSADDIKRNKAAFRGAMDLLKFGKNCDKDDKHQASAEEEEENDSNHSSRPERTRESLERPPPPDATWSDYILSEPGKHPRLAREHKVKIVENAFKASVAISQDFPMSKSDLFELLSIIPLKHFKKMQEFIELKLPDGFPVRLDIPLLPFLSARITFSEFAFIDGPVDESLFSIPSDYVEDRKLFSSLTGKFMN